MYKWELRLLKYAKPEHSDDYSGDDNYTSTNCLHYYASKELDIEVRVAYKNINIWIIN